MKIMSIILFKDSSKEDNIWKEENVHINGDGNLQDQDIWYTVVEV
jgi:hypothetical protein